MEKREILIKENKAFRLKIRQHRAVNPVELNSIEFVQECLDKDGEVDFISTYQFNMTDEELIKVSDSLKELIK
jgi:hypothetical protein